MPLKGSDLNGVYLGVDFLKNVALDDVPPLGKKVAVIGGGNTAIDCARTALRLGCEVTIIYRRTRHEMPAEEFEIDAAEKEGVKFMMLTNPVEYITDTPTLVNPQQHPPFLKPQQHPTFLKGSRGVLNNIKIEIMKLTDPDSSGRRKPVGTGEYETHDFDTVIAAISQIPDVECLEKFELPLTQWTTADVDEKTMFTGKGNIFAGGDFRRGAATAIEAIADGKVAALGIDRYLKGDDLQNETNNSFTSQKEKKLKHVDKKIYNLLKKMDKIHPKELDFNKRINFDEVELTYSEEEAQAEAKRCIECKCKVNQKCYLRKYASEYNVKIEYLTGEKNIYLIDESHQKIKRDENKCIKCGRCVRICAEVHGLGVLGFVNRGFYTTIGVDSGENLVNSKCDGCGKCVDACPTGGIVLNIRS